MEYHQEEIAYKRNLIDLKLDFDRVELWVVLFRLMENSGFYQWSDLKLAVFNLWILMKGESFKELTAVEFRPS